MDCGHYIFYTCRFSPIRTIFVKTMEGKQINDFKNISPFIHVHNVIRSDKTQGPKYKIKRRYYLNLAQWKLIFCWKLFYINNFNSLIRSKQLFSFKKDLIEEKKPLIHDKYVWSLVLEETATELVLFMSILHLLCL